MENQKLNQIKDELRQKQINIIKETVLLTLEKLNDLEKKRNDLLNQIRVLKHDLYDLKDGRLDRILERQGLNEEVKSVSVFIVTKLENVVGTPPWYENYNLCIKKEEGDIDCKLNSSVVKTHASGSYKLKDGSFKYL